MISYELYGFGSNGKGQLGVGHESDLILPELSFSSIDVSIEKIACGGNHSLLLLRDGSLYWCGDNSFNQCDSESGTKSLQWIQLAGKYVDVACGWEFSLVIDSEGWVKTRGRGDKGELGVPCAKKQGCEWSVLFQCDSIGTARCYSAFEHCVVVDGNKIYAWGNNRKNQTCAVGENATLKIVDRPVLIYEEERSLRSQIEVSLGKDFTCVLLRPETKAFQLILWGRLSADADSLTSRLDGSHASIKKVDSMWSSLHVLTDQNTMVCIGRGTHGQLLQEEVPKGTVTFAAGSEHGILYTTDQEVYCWGWGEHGNCGPLTPQHRQPVNDKSNVVSPLNLVKRFEGCRVVKVFGGCATTWIITAREE